MWWLGSTAAILGPWGKRKAKGTAETEVPLSCWVLAAIYLQSYQKEISPCNGSLITSECSSWHQSLDFPSANEDKVFMLWSQAKDLMIPWLAAATFVLKLLFQIHYHILHLVIDVSSLDCCSTNWVSQTAEIYRLTVLEPSSPRSRCWQGWFLLRAVREGSSRLLFLPYCRLSSLRHHIIFPLWISPFYKDTSRVSHTGSEFILRRWL